eukprot:CAMPEP_0177641600 /NCGR_PEP_ID=MMETSP0447-20121125/7150_1 /TAXON_ID=0 /ORGANISM="Stygamoeba regulata, Strain BSH-02190019" /LENGTH=207 /DNA_ID=CAMNT_0019143723 /DNA_START=112 /DNA_END=731 /DNA_ORIENTATION=+
MAQMGRSWRNMFGEVHELFRPEGRRRGCGERARVGDWFGWGAGRATGGGWGGGWAVGDALHNLRGPSHSADDQDLGWCLPSTCSAAVFAMLWCNEPAPASSDALCLRCTFEDLLVLACRGGDLESPSVISHGRDSGDDAHDSWSAPHGSVCRGGVPPGVASLSMLRAHGRRLPARWCAAIGDVPEGTSLERLPCGEPLQVAAAAAAA